MNIAKNLVELERPAIWRPIRNRDISVRKYSSYPYMKRGVMGMSSPMNPVIRYAKNYTKYKLEFSLCLFTNETDISAVEGYFESLKKKINKEQVQEALKSADMAHLDYLDSYYDKENK